MLSSVLKAVVQSMFKIAIMRTFVVFENDRHNKVLAAKLAELEGKMNIRARTIKLFRAIHNAHDKSWTHF